MPLLSLLPQQCSKKASASLMWLLKSSGIIANRPWPRISLTVITTAIILIMAVFNMVSSWAGSGLAWAEPFLCGPPCGMGWLVFIWLGLVCVWMFLLVYISTHHMHVWCLQRAEKRASDPLDLKLRRDGWQLAGGFWGSNLDV